LEEDNFVGKFAKTKKMLNYAWQEFLKNIVKINRYIFLIRVFNFLKGRLELTHAFSHSYLSFLDFFDQVMHFCKSP
jgi:hypothetical protein